MSHVRRLSKEWEATQTGASKPQTVSLGPEEGIAGGGSCLCKDLERVRAGAERFRR